MILALAVGLAAAIGAVCRYALDLVIQQRHDSILPWGTFTINASGSLAEATANIAGSLVVGLAAAAVGLALAAL